MAATEEILADGLYVLKQPAKLPEELDLLVVGGGPAGTAAAFRAKEKGLSVLVIDYDDVMKRIRDYAKNKLILPDFGGGDKMKFPKGEALVSLLHFSPIDKDDMCVQWKGFYREQSVPAQVGVELLGLQRRNDGVWQVKTYNHNSKSDQEFLAKHVAIGIGRGVPRRFDIPGNTDGIAYRLTDAVKYVGAPACVLGGGTSAAEAVIAISHAKINAKDASPVYWSYRSDKLPKVSKALAEAFFEAYMGNGNIRYHPNSDPVAVVTADDRKDYLSIQTDRRILSNRPNETSHLEFQKEFCIACIGEDIPEAFLNSLGIHMATVAGGKKRMLVTPLLETQQPNVYLIGDMLSQAYMETDSFDADPATYREVKHRGNIKAALVDGVLVAEIVAQRIAGKEDIDVNVVLEEGDTSPLPAQIAMQKATVIGTLLAETIPDVTRQAVLVRVLAGNVEEEEFEVKMSGVTTIGRKFCDIAFPEDEMMSERHASLLHGVDGFSLRDDGSATGVFLRATEGKALEITPGDLVRAGRQFLLFGEDHNFTHYDQTGKKIGSHKVADKTLVLGREAPDITLNKDDMTLSRRHLSLAVKEEKMLVKDLNSVNGTYLKVRSAMAIEPGDRFRVGREMFKLQMQETKQPVRVHVTSITPAPPPKPAEKPKQEEPKPAKAPTQVSPANTPADGKPAGMTVSFKNAGKSIGFAKGQSVCEIAEKNGVKISAECHSGICGSDPIRILSGKENLNPLGDDEKGTLEDICGVPAGECRLACMTKPSGPVEVEIIS
jgi:thioredoxin reductase/ferredoxin/pSer/pThr/pTyr-binding forkhead associated (FHA) protein